MLTASNYFDLPDSLPFGEFFEPGVAPWIWIQKIKQALAEYTFSDLEREAPAGLEISGPVFIHPSVKLPPFGSIKGPAYIGEGCELRPGVYIRGNVIAGAGCVLGNSCEFKNSLLLDHVQVPHFSYVGDSVLGNRAHLGAGVICSNLRLDQTEIKVKDPNGGMVETGMRKFGAVLGDAAEVGCNTVLNPGSILGKRSLVMPSMAFRGVLSAENMAFSATSIRTTARPS